jgi:hypothetical protein
VQDMLVEGGSLAVHREAASAHGHDPAPHRRSVRLSV